MSAFEDFAASVTGLSTTLLNAAEGKGDTSDATLRSNYIIARVNIVVAEALAKHAAEETAENAKKLVESAAVLISKSERQLLDAASAKKAELVQDVKDAYHSALDLGVAAAKGVGAAVDARVQQVFWTFEAQVLTAGAALALYLWWQSKKSAGPSAAQLRKALAS